MQHSIQKSRRSLRHSSLEQAVADAFRGAGWDVLRLPVPGKLGPDLIVRRGARRYVVELKSAPEARRDRLLPLFAQAILEAKAVASKSNASPRMLPLAIIGAPRVPAPLFEDLRSFASQVAPEVAVGIVDLQGSREFIGPGLESLNAHRARPRNMPSVPPPAPSLDLFSDLNQWMLKVLLASRIPERLLQAPRGEFKSVSALAQAAGVSVMSAFRCVSLLKESGFVDEGSPFLRLVRVEQLMQRWRSASIRPIRELPMRWLIPGNPDSQLSVAVREYIRPNEPGARRPRGSAVQSVAPRPRLCLALYAAARALGFGFVRGVVPHLYVEHLDPPALERLGLVPAGRGQRSDVIIRVPSARESIFRAAVNVDGLPASDVLQVWLDVADHPSRGPAQARQIWQRVLGPVVKESAR